MYTRPTVAPDAPTLARPQLAAVAPPVRPAPAPPAPKSGWVIGGIAFTLAAAALSVIGTHAVHTISWSPDSAAVSVAVSTVPATPVAPVPVAAAVPLPAAPVIPVAPRVVVVRSSAPTAAQPAAAEPETRPAPPIDVPAPLPAHIDPPKHCGDFAACVPLPPFTLPPKPPQNCGIVVCHPRR
ncbi:hypothetical protein ACXPWS_09660 [Mycobacterium sp. BMJ-28]